MEFSLDGQVAVVTGATRGIGRCIAETFLAHGARVVLNGRSQAKGEQAVKEIDRGDDVAFIAGDAASKTDMESLVDAAVQRFGRLDVLVNNAGGITGHGMVREMSDEAWLGTIDLNLNSVFFATRRALKYFEPQESGRIINISSVESKQANKAAVSNYIATKAAINGFTKAVAFEYGPIGITCNAIAPGAIETDIMRASRPDAAKAAGITYEQFLQDYANESMIKRLNRVEEVGAMALLLASELAAASRGRCSASTAEARPTSNERHRRSIAAVAEEMLTSPSWLRSRRRRRDLSAIATRAGTTPAKGATRGCQQQTCVPPAPRRQYPARLTPRLRQARPGRQRGGRPWQRGGDFIPSCARIGLGLIGGVVRPARPRSSRSHGCPSAERSANHAVLAGASTGAATPRA